MALAAGRLRHSVDLESRSYAQDPVTGDNTLTWVRQATVRAAIEPLSAREFVAAQATQSEVVARIIIRYRSDIDASWRVVHRGKIYNIQGVLPDIDSGIEYLTLPVSQGVSDGS